MATSKRFAVYGASGRVGARLVEAILASPGMELAAAHVSPTSSWIGGQVGNTAIEYRQAVAQGPAGSTNAG